MKKLSKLQINPEKLMKNEELMTLRGGYSCWCWNCDTPGWMLGAGDPGQCASACWEIGCSSTWYYE
jgi:hypothetical protein